jgi:hypothetical protein
MRWSVEAKLSFMTLGGTVVSDHLILANLSPNITEDSKAPTSRSLTQLFA